jgi:hypothetical protein
LVITLRLVNPQDPPVPMVNGFDLFCVLEHHDPNLTVPGPEAYHLTLEAAHMLATGYTHAAALKLRAYLADGRRAALGYHRQGVACAVQQTPVAQFLAVCVG